MEIKAQLSPEQILAYNEAFAQSLRQLIDAHQHQLNGIVATAVSLCQGIASLAHQQSIPGTVIPVEQAVAIKALTEQLGNASPSASLPAASVVGTDATAVTGNASQDSSADNDLNAILQALANARNNAVFAQQQLYITAQAALTMGISTLFSVIAGMYEPSDTDNT